MSNYNDFLPYFTGDKSVGLYSKDFDDIYHSSYGALSEAFEKFVLPLNFLKKDSYKVLDVCFGLGYNTKAFLQHNKNCNILFDCLDIDKNLFLLSPFVKTNTNFIRNIKHSFFRNYGQKFLPDKHKERIVKYICQSKNKKYKIDDWINLLLIINLSKIFDKEFYNNEVLKNNEFDIYFEKKFINFAGLYKKIGYKDNNLPNKTAFLHNIYYWYLSNRYISSFITNKKINFYVGDARNTIQNLTNKYDVILLDAFTTNKCPQLWSIEFITKLYELTADDGILITYSSSATVRNTLKSAGYYIGKSIDEKNKSIGTIASKNPKHIKYCLNEYENGLLKTKAGIPYRDNNLSTTPAEIINRRLNELNNSSLISSSKYIKANKGVKNEI